MIARIFGFFGYQRAELLLTREMRIGKSTKLTAAYQKRRVRELRQARRNFEAGA